MAEFLSRCLRYPMNQNRADLKLRKTDHLRVNIERDVHSLVSPGFDDYYFVHQALPEIDLAEVDTSSVLFGRKLNFPLLISSMTGGTEAAFQININLARAAQEAGIAMGVGSQRAGIDHPSLKNTYQIRKVAPQILLFANIGAVQLNNSYSIEHCRRAVEMIEADALFLHLNPLQEAIQPEGNTNFRGLLSKIERVCREIQAPVVIKEVGWGISEKVARQLYDAGVSAIDVAGAGGVSWSQVEMYRLQDENMAQIASAFRDWGIPTATSLQVIRHALPQMMVFASGGLRSGIDLAKSVALGATLGGMAHPFLKAAVESYDKIISLIDVIHQQLKISMFLIGAKDISTLKVTSCLVKKTWADHVT